MKRIRRFATARRTDCRPRRRLEAVGIEHLGPQVDVVAGGVARAREQMLEVRQPVVEADARRHAELGQLVALEGDDVGDRRIGARMRRHVDERRRGVAHRLVALVEVASRVQLFDQRVGDRLAGRWWRAWRLSTSGSSSQCSKSCDGSSTKSRSTLVPESALVGDVREQAVQAVAELVEQRSRVVEAEQRRLARRALGEIVVVDDDRQHRRGRRRRCATATIGAHPGAAALGRPREVVVQEQADRLPPSSRTS